MGIDKCCKTCHWYGDDKHCYHPKTFKANDFGDYQVGLISEEGKISAALEEIIDFNKIDFSSFENVLLKSLSKKKVNEILSDFIKILEDKKPGIIMEIDCNITDVIDDELNNQNGLPVIIEPDNFCCNNYL